MNVGKLDSVLWAASFVGQVALFLVLLIRRRVSSFPIFTAFIGYESLDAIALFFISRHFRPHVYFIWYFLFAAGDFAFQLAIIWEIARDVLRPTGTWIRDARRSFLLWSAIGILVAVVLSISIPRAGLAGAELWDMRVDVFTSLLTCEVFLAMIFAANRLGLQWRSHVMALGQGLTVWALASILGDLGSVATGWGRYLSTFDHARIVVYIGTLGFWIVAFWLPERQRAPLSADMRNYLLALHTRLQYDLDSVNRLDGPSL